MVHEGQAGVRVSAVVFLYTSTILLSLRHASLYRSVYWVHINIHIHTYTRTTRTTTLGRITLIESICNLDADVPRVITAKHTIQHFNFNFTNHYDFVYLHFTVAASFSFQILTFPPFTLLLQRLPPPRSPPLSSNPSIPSHSTAIPNTNARSFNGKCLLHWSRLWACENLKNLSFAIGTTRSVFVIEKITFGRDEGRNE